MLSVFYCFAHPERGTAGALINGWSAGLAGAAVSLGVLTHGAAPWPSPSLLASFFCLSVQHSSRALLAPRMASGTCPEF